MNRLGIFFIAGALVISALLTILVYTYKKSSPAAPTVETEMILVAAQNLNAGSTLSSSDIVWQPWPKEKISSIYIRKNAHHIDEYVGSIVRENITANSPISESMLISRGEMSPLTRVLKPGMRAFTVDVSTASAIAGLISPGDTVDIILTYNINKNNITAPTRFVSKTILTNIQVIAVDQTVLISVESVKASRSPSDIKYVTLEVTPKQAELLAVSKSVGTLSLSLSRPGGAIESNEEVESERPGQNIIFFHGDRAEQPQQNNSGS